MILILEAIIFGIIILVLGTIISFVISKYTITDLPSVCKDWNKNHIMEISLFITGFISYLICYLVGLNSWYCKNGNTCINIKKT